MNLDRLKEIREDRDLLQKDIANVLNISQVQYFRYETGLRLMPVDKLAKLAQFYNVSIDYLLYLTAQRRPYPKNIVNNKDS